MRLHRVFVHHPGTRSPAGSGHPLFVRPRQGGGRVDDPQHEYLVLYCSNDPAGAVAEAFGGLTGWEPEMFDGPPALPGSALALATYDTDRARLLDLDDAAVLLDLGLRPSEVVTRDREVTQRWARRVHDTGRWHGVGWWSYRDPRWHSYGIWARERLRVAGVEPLDLGHPAVVAAADVLNR